MTGSPRLYIGSAHPQGPETSGAQAPLAAGQVLDLPGTAARHAQVLRLQPGSPVRLFDGQGGQWQARVHEMGRQAVAVELQAHEAVERELAWGVTLALCMPANDRMDDLVEKATELGVAAIVPLMGRRSVLRLSGERASRKQLHWQAVAVAACEQSGRNRVPVVHPVQEVERFLGGQLFAPAGGHRWLLSLDPQALPLVTAGVEAQKGASTHFLVLSGPEGGWDPDEEVRARQAGFAPVSLGPRTLRADTAPLAALAALAALSALPTGSPPSTS